jgi:hypothetical protein
LKMSLWSMMSVPRFLPPYRDINLNYSRKPEDRANPRDLARSPIDRGRSPTVREGFSSALVSPSAHCFNLVCFDLDPTLKRSSLPKCFDQREFIVALQFRPFDPGSSVPAIPS